MDIKNPHAEYMANENLKRVMHELERFQNRAHTREDGRRLLRDHVRAQAMVDPGDEGRWPAPGPIRR